MFSNPKVTETFPLLGIAQYHAKTIWLFTQSDLKTMVFPTTLFAIASALAGIEQGTSSTFLHNAQIVLERIPTTVLWVWINLLPFTIGNQRKSASIAEDRVNKPWRPIAAGRISPKHATTLMKASYALAALISLSIGGFLQCISLIGLGYVHNDIEEADTNFVLRNLLNGAGYIAFVSGALETVLDVPITSFQPRTISWLLMIGAVIVTSIHAQDMPDQDGDRLRSRRTLPLVLGDGTARWTIAIAILSWSIFCPMFWRLNLKGFMLPIFMGSITGGRFLVSRTVAADKTSYFIYNLWVTVLYILPLAKQFQVMHLGSTLF